MKQKTDRPVWWPEGDEQMTPEMASAMIAALTASDLSVAAFARQHEIPKQRIFYWRERLSKLKRKQGSVVRKRDGQPVGFAPMVVKAGPSGEAAPPASRVPMQTLEATLASGSRVVVHGQWDATSMRAWLAAIDGDRC